MEVPVTLHALAREHLPSDHDALHPRRPAQICAPGFAGHSF
jgi:hypothetical protein